MSGQVWLPGWAGALAGVLGAGVAWVGGAGVRTERSTRVPLSQETPTSWLAPLWTCCWVFFSFFLFAL